MLKIQKIVCPTDFSEPSCESIKAAGAVARQFGAELYLVHVIEPVANSPALFPGEGAFVMPQYDADAADGAGLQLRKLVEQHQFEDIQVWPVVRCGPPADEILDVAQLESADLIVIASHGERGWRRYLFGSVTDDVLYSAPCPVLVVKGLAASTADELKQEEQSEAEMKTEGQEEKLCISAHW